MSLASLRAKLTNNLRSTNFKTMQRDMIYKCGISLVSLKIEILLVVGLRRA